MFINKACHLFAALVYDEHCFCANYREYAKQALTRSTERDWESKRLQILLQRIATRFRENRFSATFQFRYRRNHETTAFRNEYRIPERREEHYRTDRKECGRATASGFRTKTQDFDRRTYCRCLGWACDRSNHRRMPYYRFRTSVIAIRKFQSVEKHHSISWCTKTRSNSKKW